MGEVITRLGGRLESTTGSVVCFGQALMPISIVSHLLSLETIRKATGMPSSPQSSEFRMPYDSPRPLQGCPHLLWKSTNISPVNFTKVSSPRRPSLPHI